MRRAVLRWRAGRLVGRGDRLAGEEPLEIRAAGPGQEPVAVAVTMRTPGNDFELAAGFLFTEGLIGQGEITRVSYCDGPDTGDDYNVVTVRLRRPFVAPERRFHLTSSCGVCGKAAIDQVEVSCAPVTSPLSVTPEVLLGLPGTLRAAQRVFDTTGGLHAAGAFDAGGRLLAVREDVGRHNALDKLIGRELLGAGPLFGERVLLVSGRIGFEIVQKAALARAPVLCAVSAPSSLAVEAGERLGVTLVGFLRPGGFNLYSHPERVRTEA